MYKSLKINFPEVKEYFTDDNSKQLDNLSRINIFIGPNNSGKSRFLRSLFAMEKPVYKPISIDLTKLNSTILKLVEEVNNITEHHKISRLSTCPQPKESTINYIPDDEPIIRQWNTYCYNLMIIDISSIKSEYLSRQKATVVQENLKQIGKSYAPFFQKQLTTLDGSRILNNMYVPILRGLRGVEFGNNDQPTSESRDVYKKRTMHDYFQTRSDLDEHIYTGLSLYDDVKKLLLSYAPNRKLIKEFETFLGDTFFEGQPFTILPHIDDNVVYVKIGDADDMPIYQLGDGVQAIIILTYPLFFNQGKNINFHFEEPDINLHPGFQRIFLETLMHDKFKSFQYFFTTHSNHFLDMTLDFEAISIYTFKKRGAEHFQITNVKNDDKNILQILGIKNSSVFLTNCTIWVEGITDRMYIRRYLELVQEKNGTTFKEDIHFSFVEYGGGNITHWSFLDAPDLQYPNIDVEKLCGTLFLISDQDNARPTRSGGPSKKQLRQQELKEKLGDSYYCLEAREIENLLHEEVIINTLKKLEGSQLNEIDFKKIKSTAYQKEPLGKFLSKIEGLSNNYADASGTITQKVKFAKAAIPEIKSIEQMSEEAQKMTNLILTFIKNNN